MHCADLKAAALQACMVAPLLAEHLRLRLIRSSSCAGIPFSSSRPPPGLAHKTANASSAGLTVNTPSMLPVLKGNNLKSEPYLELIGHGVNTANTTCIVPYVFNLQRRAVERCPNKYQRHMLKVVEAFGPDLRHLLLQPYIREQRRLGQAAERILQTRCSLPTLASDDL